MKSHKWKKWIMGYVIFMVIVAVVLALSFSRLLSIGRRAMDSLWVCVLLILFAAAGMFLTSLLGQISILWEKFSLREVKISETNEKKKDGLLPPEDDGRQEETSRNEAETKEADSMTKEPEKQGVVKEVPGEEDSAKRNAVETDFVSLDFVKTPSEKTDAVKTDIIITNPVKPNDMQPVSVKEQLMEAYRNGSLMRWPGRKVLNIRPEYLNKTKLSYNTELEFKETNSSSSAFILVEGKYVFPAGRYCERPYDKCKNTFDKLHFGEIYDYENVSPYAVVKNVIPAEVVNRGTYYVVRKKGIIEMKS